VHVQATRMKWIEQREHLGIYIEALLANEVKRSWAETKNVH